MLKRIDGPPEARAKYKARRKMKEQRDNAKNKTRPKDELQALREEVEELRAIIEILCET